MTADVVQVSPLHTIADSPDRPACNWCGRNRDNLVDDSRGGAPLTADQYTHHQSYTNHAFTCPPEDWQECDQARTDRMPRWIETWYPTLANQGYTHLTRTPWGMLSLWRNPEEAKRYGFHNLALSAEDPEPVAPLPEPVPEAQDDYLMRQQAAREQIVRWAERRARELVGLDSGTGHRVALSGGRGMLMPETADAPPDAPVPAPSPAVTSFEAAHWGHTIRGGAHIGHLISGGAVHWVMHTDE